MDKQLADLLMEERKDGNVRFVVNGTKVVAVFELQPHEDENIAALGRVHASHTVAGGYTIAYCPSPDEAQKAASQMANRAINVADVIDQQAEKTFCRVAICELGISLDTQQLKQMMELEAQRQHMQAHPPKTPPRLSNAERERVEKHKVNGTAEPLVRIRYNSTKLWLGDLAAEVGLASKYQIAMNYIGEDKYNVALNPEQQA